MGHAQHCMVHSDTALAQRSSTLELHFYLNTHLPGRRKQRWSLEECFYSAEGPTWGAGDRGDGTPLPNSQPNPWNCPSCPDLLHARNSEGLYPSHRKHHFCLCLLCLHVNMETCVGTSPENPGRKMDGIRDRARWSESAG